MPASLGAREFTPCKPMTPKAERKRCASPFDTSPTNHHIANWLGFNETISERQVRDVVIGKFATACRTPRWS